MASFLTAGHQLGIVPTYSWWVPGSAVGASKLYADIYNSSASTGIVEFRGVWAIPKADVANAAVLPIEVGLYRTNAVGTGGAAFTYNGGTGSSAHVITPLDTSNSSGVFGAAGVSARSAPTGGATITALYWAQYVFLEEISPATYVCAMTNLLPQTVVEQGVTLRPGQGMLIKQGAVASTGSVAFLGQFAVI